MISLWRAEVPSPKQAINLRWDFLWSFTDKGEPNQSSGNKNLERQTYKLPQRQTDRHPITFISGYISLYKKKGVKNIRAIKDNSQKALPKHSVSFLSITIYIIAIALLIIKGDNSFIIIKVQGCSSINALFVAQPLNNV